MLHFEGHVIPLIQPIVIFPSPVHFHLAPIKGINKLASFHNVPTSKLKQFSDVE